MSFAWQVPKKEQVLRGENKVQFIHVNVPWPYLASWDGPSLFPSPSLLSGWCPAASASHKCPSSSLPLPSSCPFLLSLSPSIVPPFHRHWVFTALSAPQSPLSQRPFHFLMGWTSCNLRMQIRNCRGQDLKTGSVSWKEPGRFESQPCVFGSSCLITLNINIPIYRVKIVSFFRNDIWKASSSVPPSRYFINHQCDCYYQAALSTPETSPRRGMIVKEVCDGGRPYYHSCLCLPISFVSYGCLWGNLEAKEGCRRNKQREWCCPAWSPYQVVTSMVTWGHQGFIHLRRQEAQGTKTLG